MRRVQWQGGGGLWVGWICGPGGSPAATFTGGGVGAVGGRVGAGCWMTEEEEAGPSPPFAKGAIGFGMTGVEIGGAAG